MEYTKNYDPRETNFVAVAENAKQNAKEKEKGGETKKTFDVLLEICLISLAKIFIIVPN